MNTIEKGTVTVMGLYDGTAVSCVVSRRGYAVFSKAIKDAGREQLVGLMAEFGTKELAADVLQEQMVELNNKLLAISTFVSEEVLKRAWGANYKRDKAIWMMNISTLLYLKRIKNDEMYGWVLMDHNSSVALNDEEGPTIMVGDNDSSADKLMKKANALMKAHTK